MKDKYLGYEQEYLRYVLGSESWAATAGNLVDKLEKDFTQFRGQKYGVAFNSCTSALHAALVAVGAKKDDVVISPALTVAMDTFVTRYINATPIYCDIEDYTWCMDSNSLKRIIDKYRVGAIILVSLYGVVPKDLDAIFNIAKSSKIPLILDNAQGLSLSYVGHKIEEFADITCFSFENSKILSSGEGGMLLTNNEEYATIARKLGGLGFKNLTADNGRVKVDMDVFQNPSYERHDYIGYNYRMSEFQAAVALGQFGQRDIHLRTRTNCAIAYNSVIETADCNFLKPQENYWGSNYWTYTVSLDNSIDWVDFRRVFIKNGGEGVYGAWQLPYREPFMSKKRSFYEGTCPVAESIQPTLMQFKTNFYDPNIRDQQAEALRKTILEF